MFREYMQGRDTAIIHKIMKGEQKVEIKNKEST